MVCIYCSGETQVINSRSQKRLNSVWRRRKCLQCQAVFTSQEVAQYAGTWRVSTGGGKNGLQPFDRDKLLLSIHASLQHRPDAPRDASALTATVISKLQPQATAGLLQAEYIAITVHAVLSNFDDVASVHYAAFHRKA